MSKPRVALFVEYYLPGFRAGGPVRSVSALVQQLGGEIDFHIIARDRDEGSTSPYPDCLPGRWTPVGNAHVLYLQPREIGARRLAAAVRESGADMVYLNGFFGPMSLKLLLARRLGALKGVPILLAPRGELSSGALRLKSFKKRSFLQLSRWTGLHDDVVFHASTTLECDEIATAIRLRQAPRVARNSVALDAGSVQPAGKASGSVRFVFISRIARKKNLHLALDLLRSLHGSIELTIHGPVFDDGYWRQCCAQIEELPPNVRVTYGGPIAHDLVGPTFAAHHFFLFPSASENFAHAIVESLLAGCPVVTSDQTPWRGLSQDEAGWDLPLEDREAWRRVLQECVDMDAAAYARTSSSARALGIRIATTDTVAENLQLFRSMFDGPRALEHPHGVVVA